MRLDRYLVDVLGIESRTKAQNCIKDGYVVVDKNVIKKPSFDVETTMDVKIIEHKSYVSRAAWKLVSFLEQIQIDLDSKEALDIGSSTGGFCEVLLEYGVKRVVAVDVGKEQLHSKLRTDKRVEVFEETDIREFEHTPFDIVVSDVSFISLLHILDSVHRLAKKDIILLFKPQFEVGVGVKRDKKGVVLDKKAIDQAMIRFEDATKLLGWRLIKKAPAAITGKDGNLEYCYYFQK